MLKKKFFLLFLITIYLFSLSYAVDTKVKIEEGETVYVEALEESEEVNIITSKVPIKFFVEYADTLLDNEFTFGIDPKIAIISSYMFIEYSDTILSLNLIVDDGINKSSNIGARIRVEYADTIMNAPLIPALF
jgi:hypothetical protein